MFFSFSETKRVYFHLFLLLYSSGSRTGLRIIIFLSPSYWRFIMFERNFFFFNCIYTLCINNPVYTLYLIKNTVCKTRINVTPEKKEVFAFVGRM